MVHTTKQRSTLSAPRLAPVLMGLACSLLFLISNVFAAPPGVVDIGPMTVAPDQVTPGQHPSIDVRVNYSPKAKGESVMVNIVAVVTQPDNRVKSWNWKKIRISRNSSRSISVPQEYDTSVKGAYRVEIIVYSEDMKRRYASQNAVFSVIERQQMQQSRKKEPEGGKEQAAVGKAGTERERVYAGLGIYGNALNPAGGGVLMLWPSKYVGLEGLYSTGEFTSYEGRLLFKYDMSSTYSVYGGIGYLHVSVDKDIIGVTTRFEDSGVSGVAGVEVALGKRFFLYVESSAAKIDLERTVTNGGQTVVATVKYAPVTIGCALVWEVF